MGGGITLEMDPMRDRRRIEKVLESRSGVSQLDYTACVDLHERYTNVISLMKRVRRERPLSRYNDSYWATGATQMSHLQVVGSHYGDDITAFQFKGSGVIYLLYEYENSFYQDALIELKQWFFDHESHESHRLMFTVLKEKVGHDDEIYIIKDAKLRLNDSPILIEVPIRSQPY